ncbi:hypothetical protein B0H12DRAFT_1308057 [Mycena haematopus]|nr:hypothetical protein B0H12DRAFT_1308057 [Mycena haematopus]
MSWVGENREAVGVWENGPGFRDPNFLHAPNDGSSLVSQDSIRSHHKRLWRLHYNKYARHIPYAVVARMSYPINKDGVLLEDLEPTFEGHNHLGNPIEKGGRPWKQPVPPRSPEKAAKRAQKKLAAGAGLGGADDVGTDLKGKGKAGLRRSKRITDFQSGLRDEHIGEVELNQAPGEVGIIWKSGEFSSMQDILTSDNPRAEGLEVARIDTNFARGAQNGLDEASVFMLEAVEFSRAHQSISEYNLASVSEPHLELAFMGMINNPTAVETCLHISRAWSRIKDMYAEEAKAVLSLKLQRQSIMQTTYTFWTWLDGYCTEIIRNALDSQEPLNHWISSLTRHVRTLLLVRGPPRELRSSDFGAAILEGRYAFRARHTLAPASDLDVTRTVIDILATWLKFPVGGKSRAQAWFIDAIFHECHPAALYLDSVWFAFTHLETEVFGELTDGLPSPVAYQRLKMALRSCALTDPTSETHLVIMDLEALVTDYRRRTAVVTAMTASTSAVLQNQGTISGPHTVMQRQVTGSSVSKINTSSRPRPGRVAAGPSAPLMLADDATQLHKMMRFLEYLVELEPLIDGGDHIQSLSSLQAYVKSRLDFLLPFREHGPSRVKSRGPTTAFDPSHSRTWAGLFSGLIFRGVTFASPFAVQAAKTFFLNVGDWDAECAKHPGATDDFFCNAWAYSKRKSTRTVSLVSDYWTALTTPDCPDWEVNTANRCYDFRACYNFLKETSPSRFKEIGSLAGFLLTADFYYAGAVAPPTVQDVGEIIRGINKGGVRGLELLGLVQERERGKGRTYKMASTDEVRAAFGKLYGFLDRNLSDVQKQRMVFDSIMTENSLCKFSRVVGANKFVV